MAVVVADKDPDVPVAYIETYQNDLFSKTDKINFKGYSIEVTQKSKEGAPSQVKINKRGQVDVLDLSKINSRN